MIGQALVEEFGLAPDEQAVQRITLRKGKLTAKILTFGAIVQDLRHADVDHPLVLGAETLPPYFDDFRYFGAMVGRFANRIANGRFRIDGQDFQVSRNFLGTHCLHGGAEGADRMLWTLKNATPGQAILKLVMPDGHMGFPGQLQVSLRISLRDDAKICFEVTANASLPTPCCFAHHSYFNLDGSPDITDHSLEVFADTFLPLDAECIPTGEQRAMQGSEFDFTTAQPIGRRGLDHNFCLSNHQRALVPAARVSAQSGLVMTVETTEPGLQVYDAAHLPVAGLQGLEGRRYGPNAGLALEAQAWPDAPNRSDFPNAILSPGETYHSQTCYRFDAICETK